MMKKTLMVIAAILTTVVGASAQTPSPNLEETTRWIHSTLDPSGLPVAPGWGLGMAGSPLLFPNEYNGYNGFQTLIPRKINPNKNEETILSFTFVGCKCKVQRWDSIPNTFGGMDVFGADGKVTGKSPMVFRSSYEDTFDLKDFDPSRVELDHDDTGNLKEFPGLIGRQVRINTTNDLKTVHCTSVWYELGKKPIPDACVPANASYEDFRFNTKEYTLRFAKAITHAIVLCGGKKAPF